MRPSGPEGDEPPSQGAPKAPRGKPGRTTANEARKIKNKKLKLAYLARVQRTLEVARRLESSACKQDPISFVMQPMDEVCAISLLLLHVERARVKDKRQEGEMGRSPVSDTFGRFFRAIRICAW